MKVIAKFEPNSASVTAPQIQKMQRFAWERNFLLRNQSDGKLAVVSLNLFERVDWTVREAFGLGNYYKFKSVFGIKEVKVISLTEFKSIAQKAREEKIPLPKEKAKTKPKEKTKSIELLPPKKGLEEIIEPVKEPVKLSEESLGVEPIQLQEPVKIVIDDLATDIISAVENNDDKPSVGGDAIDPIITKIEDLITTLVDQTAQPLSTTEDTLKAQSTVHAVPSTTDPNSTLTPDSTTHPIVVDPVLTTTTQDTQPTSDLINPILNTVVSVATAAAGLTGQQVPSDVVLHAITVNTSELYPIANAVPSTMESSSTTISDSTGQPIADPDPVKTTSSTPLSLAIRAQIDSILSEVTDVVSDAEDASDTTGDDIVKNMLSIERVRERIRSGDLKGAQGELKMAKLPFDEEEEMFCDIAIEYFNKNSIDAAYNILKDHVLMSDRQAAIYGAIAKAYFKNGQMDKLITLSKELADALHPGVALHLCSAGAYEEALIATDDHALMYDTCLIVAAERCKKGEFAEALKPIEFLFDEEIYADDREEPICLEIAAGLIAQGMDDEAEGALQYVINLKNQRDQLKGKLADNYFIKGKYEKTAQLVGELILPFDADEPMYLKKVDELITSEKFEEAARALKCVIGMPDERYVSEGKLADAYFAKDVYTKVIEIVTSGPAKTDEAIYMKKAEELIASEKYEEAATVLKCIRMTEKHSASIGKMADACFTKGEYARTIEIARLGQAKTDEAMYLKTVEELVEQAKHDLKHSSSKEHGITKLDQAVTALKCVVNSESKRCTLEKNIAVTYAKNGELKKSLVLLASITSHNGLKLTYTTIADHLHGEGKTKKALKIYEQLVGHKDLVDANTIATMRGHLNNLDIDEKERFEKIKKVRTPLGSEVSRTLTRSSPRK